MWRKFFVPISQKASALVLLVTVLLLAFQNCGRIEKEFTLNRIDSASKMEIKVEVTEHAVPVKTVSTDYTLQLSDRNYLAGVLSDAFGPSALATVRANILLNHDDLGGPCSEYADYRVKSGTNFVAKDPALICDEENTTKTLLPPATAIRQGWILQTCSTLVGKETNPETLNYVLGKIKAGASLAQLPMPNTENLVSLHKLFYRERPLPPESVLETLRLMFYGDAPSIEGWKMAINSYCSSSHWQVL